MTGNLDEAIRSLLQGALPALLNGAPPPVDLVVQSDHFAVDPTTADALAGEARPDDHSDQFTFDPTGIVFDPSHPAYNAAALPQFTLSKPPYAGPRRVRLLTDAGDRIPLSEREVIWDEADSRRFTLALAANRELAGVNGVQVLYGVTALFTTLKLNQTLSILLASADAGQLARCEALVAGIVALHRQELLDGSAALYEGGDYAAAVKANSLKLLEGSSPAANQRRLLYQAEIELKSTRALHDDEGRPIVRIRTPGRPLDPARPLNIDIGLEI